MDLRHINGSLFLQISEDFRIPFLEEWVTHLRVLPYEKYGDFMRGTIYKVLSLQERKAWNKSKISNRVLFDAVQELKD
jgi:hypothetical protein